jgi:hypothetical protein
MIDDEGFLRLESFMVCPIPHITTLALLVHLALGCCWHHRHTCVPAQAKDDVVAVGGGCRHHHHGKPSDEECDALAGDHDGHSHRCDGDRCHFVRSDVLQRPGGGGERVDSVPPASPFPFSSACLANLCRPNLHGFGHSDRRVADIGLPVRAHLLLGVLLI